jgi:hypothetical protein
MFLYTMILNEIYPYTLVLYLGVTEGIEPAK